MTFSAFSPCRMTTMPPTASPVPSRSATPRRGSGPRPTDATSDSRIGTPPGPVPTTMAAKSSRVRA